MKYLFVDTETNGLPADYRAAWTNVDNWPMPVSIAWILYDGDGSKLHESYSLLNQGLSELNPEAQKVHGITLEEMRESGGPPNLMYKIFLSAFEKADILVGHNLDGFDLNIILADLHRNNIAGKFNMLIADRKTFCTMRSTTSICKLPSPSGRGYKWPKLEELYRFCFGQDFPGAHNALSDVQATAECFFHLKEKGLI